MAWNNSDNSAKKNPISRRGRSLPASIKYLLAGSIVVFGVFVLMWSLLPTSEEAPVDNGKDALLKENHPHKSESKSKRSAAIRRAEVVRTGDKVADAVAQVEAIEPLRIAARPKVGPGPHQTFKTGMEQLMSWVFSTEVGEMPMPIPPIPEEDLNNIAAILTSKNEVDEKDSERAAECKALVDYAKKEMIKFIKDGGEPDDFLRYYHRELRKAFEMRNEAIDQVEALRAEDPELAIAFAKRINEKFEEEGIKRIEEYPDEEDESFTPSSK